MNPMRVPRPPASGPSKTKYPSRPIVPMYAPISRCPHPCRDCNQSRSQPEQRFGAAALSAAKPEFAEVMHAPKRATVQPATRVEAMQRKAGPAPLRPAARPASARRTVGSSGTRPPGEPSSAAIPARYWQDFSVARQASFAELSLRPNAPGAVHSVRQRAAKLRRFVQVFSPP